MLGKTHVVWSLALVHVGLLGYMIVQGRKDGDILNAVNPASPDAESASVFSMGMGEPVSLGAYLLMVLTVSFFVLLLLRTGSRRVLRGYVGLMSLCGFSLFMIYDASIFQLLIYVLLFAFGSLLPDIDSEESALGRYVPFISRVIPHRTITHTIWAVALLAGIAWAFGSIGWLALALGYTLHIIQDTFSRQGICWFYPVIGSYTTYSGGATMKKGRKPILAYKTGGAGETIMFGVSVGAHILCVVVTVWLQVA